MNNSDVTLPSEATIREATIREATIREATIREATIREATIREATIREATIREATIRKPETEPESIGILQPQPDFPLLLDVMYDGVHYIFKSTEEMVTHIAFLERKKKIIQRVRERHQNSQTVVDVE
jgi:hypothetical protein